MKAADKRSPKTDGKGVGVGSQAAHRVGLHLWRQDAADQEWSRAQYLRASEIVVAGLVDLGYSIVRPKPPKPRAEAAKLYAAHVFETADATAFPWRELSEAERKPWRMRARAALKKEG